jgi:Mandelate racemase / muconate lactonizing enzyme, N-terminal domain
LHHLLLAGLPAHFESSQPTDANCRFPVSDELTAAAIKEILLPAIAGANVTEIEQLHARMNRVPRGYPYAKAAIDVALHEQT